MPRVVLALAATTAAVLAVAPPARAEPRPKYYFAVEAIDLADGIPAALRERVRAELDAELSRHPEVVTALPAGAPDPAAAPKKFKRYMKRRKLSAYRVKVDVTEYSRAVEPMPEGRRGKRLKVSVALRLFGETIPDRTMGFTGAGSAAVALEVGKRVRPRDEQEAHRAAVEPAVGDAVAEALAKLSAPSRRRAGRR